MLEFGVFEDGRMTAAVGCGIDAAHGFRLNNSAVIRFAPGAEREELYRPVFMGVTDMLLGMGLVPFDDIQNGEGRSATRRLHVGGDGVYKDCDKIRAVKQ